MSVIILTFHRGRGIHCLSIGATMKTTLSRSDASDIPRGDFKRGIANVIALKGHYHDVANARTWSAYHLDGIFGNSGANSNETVHPGGKFSEKR